MGACGLRPPGEPPTAESGRQQFTPPLGDLQGRGAPGAHSPTPPLRSPLPASLPRCRVRVYLLVAPGLASSFRGLCLGDPPENSEVALVGAQLCGWRREAAGQRSRGTEAAADAGRSDRDGRVSARAGEGEARAAGPLRSGARGGTGATSAEPVSSQRSVTRKHKTGKNERVD